MLEIISLAREIGYGITNGRMLDKKADLKLVLVAGHDKLEMNKSLDFGLPEQA